MEFDVIQGDIAEQAADVLVNAAGTSLQMGSGVAGSLRRGAGEQINEEAVNTGPIDLGTVAATDAYGLNADWVIHAAAMPHYGDGQATRESITNATRNTLKRADELGVKSVVIPALGCGVAGFDLEEGARIISSEITNFSPSTLQNVQLIGYSDEEYETIQTVAENVRD